MGAIHGHTVEIIRAHRAYQMYTLNRHGFAKNAPRPQLGDLNSGTVPKLRSPTHRAAASDFK